MMIKIEEVFIKFYNLDVFLFLLKVGKFCMVIFGIVEFYKFIGDFFKLF